MTRSRVSIVKGSDLKDRIFCAADLVGGVEKAVGKGDIVLVKPNLVDGSPAETGETTHPEALSAVVEMAYRAGAKEVVVGESPPGNIELVRKAVEAAGGKILNFDDEPYDEVSVHNPVFFPKLRVARSILECDTFISVPTLKVNQATGLTVSFKNIYGVIPKEDKLRYHALDRIEEVIVDLNLARAPDLTIVDGSYSTIHWGPRKIFPETHRMDLAIAGFDPVAVDSVSAKVIGVEPETLRFLEWASDRGLGVSDLNEIEVSGVPTSEAYAKTTTMTEYVNRFNKHVKVIDEGSCSGCFGRIPGMILWNIRDNAMTEGVYVLIGKKAQPPAEAKNVIVCGDCAVRNLNTNIRPMLVIEGCPPPFAPLRRKLIHLGGRRPGPREFPDGGYHPDRVKTKDLKPVEPKKP